jgi:hypothetical protein
LGPTELVEVRRWVTIAATSEPSGVRGYSASGSITGLDDLQGMLLGGGMTPELFERLLYEEESTTLDFKKEQYL